MRKMLLVSALLGLSGCAARTVVTDISAAKATVAGVPFRLSVDQKVMIYQLNNKTDEYELMSSTVQRLADPSRLYAVNFSGGPFATKGLKVSQYPDNTLKLVQMNSTNNAPAAIDAVTSVLSAEATRNSAAVANAKAVVDADKAVRDAQKELDALPVGTSAETRALYEMILASAKQQALTARKAASQ